VHEMDLEMQQTGNSFAFDCHIEQQKVVSHHAQLGIQLSKICKHPNHHWHYESTNDKSQIHDVENFTLHHCHQDAC